MYQELVNNPDGLADDKSQVSSQQHHRVWTAQEAQARNRPETGTGGSFRSEDQYYLSLRRQEFQMFSVNDMFAL